MTSQLLQTLTDFRGHSEASVAKVQHWTASTKMVPQMQNPPPLYNANISLTPLTTTLGRRELALEDLALENY